MNKIVKKVQHITHYFHVYSLWGMALLLGLSYLLHDIIKYAVNLNDTYLRGIAGFDITSFNSGFYYKLLILVLIIAALLYMVVVTIGAVITRLSLTRIMRRKEYKILFSSGKYYLTLSRKPIKWLFYIYSKLDLTNATSQKKVRQQDKPAAFMSGQGFEFDCTELPSALYCLDSITFYVKDPLQLINTKVTIFSVEASNIEITGTSASKDQENVQMHDVSEGMLTMLSPKASESFLSVREYRAGDSLKKIHWKNTAKTGNYMVRQPEDLPISDKDIVLLLNLYAPMVNKIEYSKAVSGFIDSCIAQLRNIHRAYPKEQQIHLYINTKDIVKVENILQYTESYLEHLIMSACVLQDQRTVKQCIESENLTEPFIFSMSSDLSLQSLTIPPKHTAIYSIDSYFTSSWRQKMREFYFHGTSKPFTFSLDEILVRYNLIALIKRQMSYKTFKKLYIKQSQHKGKL